MNKIEIYLTNKWLYSILGFLILSLITLSVIAYNSGYNDPSVFGHSAEELESSNKGILVVNGGSEVEYDIEKRFRMELTHSTNPNTVPIPHDKLTSLCGDEDGCTLKIDYTGWSNSLNTNRYINGPLNFYYSTSDNKWTLTYPVTDYLPSSPWTIQAPKSVAGQDGDNSYNGIDNWAGYSIASTGQLQVGYCFFSEFPRVNDVSLPDDEIGMHFGVSNGAGNDIVCGLTIYD